MEISKNERSLLAENEHLRVHHAQYHPGYCLAPDEIDAQMDRLRAEIERITKDVEMLTRRVQAARRERDHNRECFDGLYKLAHGQLDNLRMDTDEDEILRKEMLGLVEKFGELIEQEPPKRQIAPKKESESK